jgi:hypothetical protein
MNLAVRQSRTGKRHYKGVFERVRFSWVAPMRKHVDWVGTPIVSPEANFIEFVGHVDRWHRGPLDCLDRLGGPVIWRVITLGIVFGNGLGEVASEDHRNSSICHVDRPRRLGHDTAIRRTSHINQMRQATIAADGMQPLRTPLSVGRSHENIVLVGDL